MFESTKKKEIGVSDLTLISKISNEAINDNLKMRFEHGEIYVCGDSPATPTPSRPCAVCLRLSDLYRTCARLCQSL